jgi:trigger factor
MKVETEQLPDGAVALSFEVDDERVERAMDAAYRRVANRVNIAGFRRGKAPRPLVERVVGRDSLLEEALNTLLPEVYEEALRETNVRAMTEPEFDVESFTPLRAKATVIAEPKVELGDYKAISHDAPEATVSEEEINAVLENLRERHAEWVPAERAAAASDRVSMDVKGTADEDTIVDQQDVDYLVDAENNAPLPGFSDQIVGMSAGEEKSFTLSVPEDDDNPRLAGKTVKFEVAVKDVKAKELPELDDFFAATVGTYKDLAELREEVTKQLQAGAEANSRQTLEQQIIDEAVESSTLDLPEKLIDYQAQRALERSARDLDSIGLTVEQYLRMRQIDAEQMRSESRASAERTLRRQLVLRGLAEQEGLAVSEEEIDEAIRTALGAEGGDEKAIARALRASEIRDRARASILEQRAVQWLIEHAIREPAPVANTGPEAGGPEAEGEQAT